MIVSVKGFYPKKDKFYTPILITVFFLGIFINLIESFLRRTLPYKVLIISLIAVLLFILPIGLGFAFILSLILNHIDTLKIFLNFYSINNVKITALLSVIN